MNSAVRDELEKKRKEIAINLYVKGKVILGKAAEIARMSVDEFMSLLRRKGIEIPFPYKSELVVDASLLIALLSLPRAGGSEGITPSLMVQKQLIEYSLVYIESDLC